MTMDTEWELMVVDNPRILVSEIEAFINEHDKKGVFSTKDKHPVEFRVHFQRIIEAGQMVAMYDRHGLCGFCSWVICDGRTKHDINKSKWTLPNDISSGNILYIDICILVRDASIFDIKNRLAKMCREKNIDKVFWYDIPHGRVFSSQLKGEKLCQTAAA